MPVRSTMASLITRVRLLINDVLPSGSGQIFADQDVQDVLDASRQDILNGVTIGKPTFSGSTIQYLDYFTALGDWEDDATFKQYLTTVVSPSTSEPIAGHWKFATSTLPPIYITGKTYDIYRASADLLERWSARLVLNFDFSSDGQSFRRSQAAPALMALAKSYRMQQRAFSINIQRSDLGGKANQTNLLGPSPIDYMASGDGR